MLVRRAPAPKAAGDHLVVVLVEGVEEVADLVVEEEIAADTRLQLPSKLRASYESLGILRARTGVCAGTGGSEVRPRVILFGGPAGDRAL